MSTESSQQPVLDALAAITAESVARCELDANSLLAARIAALAAVGAPGASYLMHVGPAMDAGVTVEQVQNILIAVAPIIGTPRTLDAALNITGALGVVIAGVAELLEIEEDAQ
jgi:alkylhydroperoxidase/carboxymuconolactone decarboxylase family protein YurZ